MFALLMIVLACGFHAHGDETGSQVLDTSQVDLAKFDFDYEAALNLSLMFYEAQRSGKLPANNRIPWRDDSALDDGADNGVDLTGGWFDAGDHVKFNFPQAFAVTMLSWGILEFKKGYVAAKQYRNVLESIRWPLDYLLKCDQLKESGKLWAQVGDGYVDHEYWGRPEDMTMDRPSYYIDASMPGSDLAGQMAAAFAAASMVFKDAGDKNYAAELLKHAVQVYNFANRYRGNYSDPLTDVVSDFYKSWSGHEDELCWGALWLAKATGDKERYKCTFTWENPSRDFGWDNQQASSELMKFIAGNETSKSHVQSFLKEWYDCPKTPKGLAFHLQWGPNRYAANAAFIALIAAKYGIDVDNAKTFAKSQINYALGATGQGYVIGFGDNYPLRPHHRGASCPDKPAECDEAQLTTTDPSPQILYGALVGGPDIEDNFKDEREDYKQSEVAVDYNACYQGALAALVAQKDCRT